MEISITCVIIDDELYAQQLIEKFVARIPALKLLAVFDSAIEALDSLDELKPDIVFLDITMPEMTGIELLKSFGRNKPNVIFTTASREFAADAFEYDATDYLIKPIPFDRFVKAVNKVRDKMRYENNAPKTTTNSTLRPVEHKNLSSDEDGNDNLIAEGAIRDNFLWVKADKKLLKLNFDDIIYVEGMKDYIKICMPKSMTVTHMTMHHMEEILITRKQFLRISRSCIINIKHMVAIEGNMIELDNKMKLNIGITYRDPIRKVLKSYLS